MTNQVTYGMVGGDLKALIGECHRKALGLDPRAKLVCGCFSADNDLNDECAEAYHVDKSRVYYDAEAMAEAEAGKIGGDGGHAVGGAARRILYITLQPRPSWSMASM